MGKLAVEKMRGLLEGKELEENNIMWILCCLLGKRVSLEDKRWQKQR